MVKGNEVHSNIPTAMGRFYEKSYGFLCGWKLKVFNYVQTLYVARINLHESRSKPISQPGSRNPGGRVVMSVTAQ